MTLDDFNKQILMPMAIDGINSGRFDNIIFSSELDEMYANDQQMLGAIKHRREILCANN